MQEKGERYLGLSLGGGKTDKAALSVLEYFPKHKKVFLTRVHDKIKSDESLSADLKIHDLILQNSEPSQTPLMSLTVDTPWTLPLCITCQLSCPGFETCQEEHVRWMWAHTKLKQKKQRPKKLFTPYTQRSVEFVLAQDLEEPFPTSHVLGANSAPLMARTFFIRRRLTVPVNEAHAPLSHWRMGKSLGILRSHLRSHRNSVRGESARKSFLTALREKNILFVYEQDFKLMVESIHSFESFVCALTGLLKEKGQTEERPKDFPVKEAWIDFPQKNINWRFSS